MNRSLISLVAVLAVSTAACVGRRTACAPSAATLLAAEIISTQYPLRPQVEDAPVYVFVPTGQPLPPLTPASTHDHVSNTAPAVTFDDGAARNSVSAVDLSTCTPLGLPAGYGHAQITFAPEGNVTRVVVDSPMELSADAWRCAGQELATARAPSFDGAPVTMGATWLVK